MDTMEDPHGPLRGEQAGELLRLALQASGLELSTWKRTHLFERPGAEASAIFEVSAQRRGDPAAAGPVGLHLVGSTVELSAEQRHAVEAVRLDPGAGFPDRAGGPAPVHLWAHPADPQLPGLGTACDSERLAQRISASRAAPVTVEELQMVVLRPLRRAVLRAQIRPLGPAPDGGGDAETVYVKVIRPERVEHQLRRHQLLACAPNAHDLGEGVLLIEQAAGRPLTEHLHRPGTRSGTEAESLDGLSAEQLTAPLESLWTEDLWQAVRELPRRRTQADRLEDYAAVAVRSGADPDRVRQLIHRIRTRLQPAPGPVVPTHGDFHPGNIFAAVRRGAQGRPQLSPTALIDVDALGPGYRADDMACLVAHLLTLPTLDPQGYASVPQVADAIWTQAVTRPDCGDLGARVAGVLLSLLPSAHTGDRRSRWLELAEKHVDQCD